MDLDLAEIRHFSIDTTPGFFLPWYFTNTSPTWARGWAGPFSYG